VKGHHMLRKVGDSNIRRSRSSREHSVHSPTSLESEVVTKCADPVLRRTMERCEAGKSADAHEKRGVNVSSVLPHYHTQMRTNEPWLGFLREGAVEPSRRRKPIGLEISRRIAPSSILWSSMKTTA
jgi:hypothetical protein